jgi:hypothetical protein
MGLTRPGLGTGVRAARWACRRCRSWPGWQRCFGLDKPSCRKPTLGNWPSRRSERKPWVMGSAAAPLPPLARSLAKGS